IEVAALDGIVELIGYPDPGGIVFLGEVGRQIGPGHEVKEIIAHTGYSKRTIRAQVAAASPLPPFVAARGCGKRSRTGQRKPGNTSSPSSSSFSRKLWLEPLNR